MTGIIGEGFLLWVITVGVIIFLGPVSFPVFFAIKHVFKGKSLLFKIVAYFLSIVFAPLSCMLLDFIVIFLNDEFGMEIPAFIIVGYCSILSLVIIVLTVINVSRFVGKYLLYPPYY